jgi:hypothetical protein
MSHTTNALTDKNQEQPKVRMRQYLYNASEPKDNYDFYVSPKFEYEFLENVFPMKRNIRRRALMIRRNQ